MSDLNGDFLYNLGGMSDYPDLARKFGDILTNRRLFEHETNEEDSRPVKRIKANQRILAILKEAKKIVPFNELFSDLMMFMSFCG